MKYVVVNLLDSPTKEYQQKLVQEIANKFDIFFTKEQALPCHFTLKYSFETDNIGEIESILKSFVEQHRRQPVRVGGFGNFRKEVMYIDVELSASAREIFSQLIANLKSIAWMPWNENDGENLHFHSTVAQKCENNFDEILNHLEGKEQYFETWFDNITLLQQISIAESGIGKWKIYKSFKLLN